MSAASGACTPRPCEWRSTFATAAAPPKIATYPCRAAKPTMTPVGPKVATPTSKTLVCCAGDTIDTPTTRTLSNDTNPEARSAFTGGREG